MGVYKYRSYYLFVVKCCRVFVLSFFFLYFYLFILFVFLLLLLLFCFFIEPISRSSPRPNFVGPFRTALGLQKVTSLAYEPKTSRPLVQRQIWVQTKPDSDLNKSTDKAQCLPFLPQMFFSYHPTRPKCLFSPAHVCMVPMHKGKWFSFFRTRTSPA